MNTKSEVVSSDDEPLILVDSQDQELGYLNKAACHDGDGRLHRAFSVFLFNSRGEVLMQKRAPGKRLWPAYWSNSCCSHPRRGESMENAVRRRVQQELGLNGGAVGNLRFIYKFEYHARFGSLGSEYELCSVYIARTSQEPVVNSMEIDDLAWVSRDALSQRLTRQPEEHTPWLQLEWAELLDKYAHELPLTRPGHE